MDERAEEPSAGAANADPRPGGSERPAAFELAITGEGLQLPTVTGSMVMARDGGPMGLKYIFVSADAAETVITLRDVAPDQAGSFDPENVSIAFPDQNLLCEYWASTTPGQLELTIGQTADGVRGELVGAVTCKQRSGAGAPVAARIEGWFER